MAWKGSPFLARLNQIILRIQANGLLIHEKNKEQFRLDLKLIKRPDPPEYKLIFEMSQLSIIFKAMTVAHSITILVFIAELYYGNK